MTPLAYERLAQMGEYIRERLTRVLRDRDIRIQVCGKGSLFLAHFTKTDLVGYRSLKGYSRTNPIYGDLCHEMLARGILTSPRSIFGALSTPMTERELDTYVKAVAESLIALE
jgi:glutamate-1-semialdehyde aminotransferase